MEAPFFSFEALLWWHWCIAGLFLLVLELLLPGVFLLWIGLGALATGGIVALTGIASWELHCLIFVPLTFVALFLGRRFIKQAAPGGDAMLNRRLASYAGRRAEVVQPIVNGTGRIRLGDTLWIARGRDCPAGSTVTVTGSEGSALLVALDEEQTP